MSNKILVLLRHAKSSWDHPGQDDHERPLNGRGHKAAKLIGRRLSTESLPIELVLSSTSIRTRETARLVLAELKNPPPVSYRDELYHASPDELVSVLRELPEAIQCVMIIGHNPGFEEFLAQFTESPADFPTAALAVIDLEIEQWASFSSQTSGRVRQFLRPKELGGD